MCFALLKYLEKLVLLCWFLARTHSPPPPPHTHTHATQSDSTCCSSEVVRGTYFVVVVFILLFSEEGGTMPATLVEAVPDVGALVEIKIECQEFCV